MSHRHHHHNSQLRPVLDALSGVEGLTSGLSVLVGRLSSTSLLDDRGIVRQINETRAALDALEREVKAHLRDAA